MSTTRLKATSDGVRMKVTFTRGEAEVELRFPVAGDDQQQEQAALDLCVLTDNIEQLIEAANTEIRVALLRQDLDQLDTPEIEENASE